MCTLSMVMDSKTDDWFQRYWQPAPRFPWVPFPGVQPVVPAVVPTPILPLPVPAPTSLELEEFRRLLDRAREYDKNHGEPDCELDSKKKLLREMADKLGVPIDFV